MRRKMDEVILGMYLNVLQQHSNTKGKTILYSLRHACLFSAHLCIFLNLS